MVQFGLCLQINCKEDQYGSMEKTALLLDMKSNGYIEYMNTVIIES